MAASRETLHQWFLKGKSDHTCTHMIVVCDTFNHEDFPVYVRTPNSVTEIEAQYKADKMLRVMEVYSMAVPIEEQLEQVRSWNL